MIPSPEAPPLGRPPGRLERLAQRLPGYRGYRERESRREVDQIARERLATRLEVARDAVVQAAAARTDAGDLQALKPLGRLERHAETLAERVRFADAGLSGLFAPIRIGTATLDQLYQLDLDALDQAEAVVAAAALLAFDPNPEPTRQALEAFEATWRRRKTLLAQGPEPSIESSLEGTPKIAAESPASNNPAPEESR